MQYTRVALQKGTNWSCVIDCLWLGAGRQDAAWLSEATKLSHETVSPTLGQDRPEYKAISDVLRQKQSHSYVRGAAFFPPFSFFLFAF